MALTPQQIEETRAQEAKKRELLRGKLNLSSFDTDKLKNSIPKNLVATGKQKLSSLFLAQGGKILQRVIPSLTDIIDKFGINDLINQDGTVDTEALKQQYCPTKAELDKLILQRNNLVDYLNGIGTKLDNLSFTVEFGAGFGSLIQGIINRIKRTQTGANIAMTFIPLGLPGAVPAAINTAGTIADNLTFKEDGTPRLPPITITASQVSPAISTTQATILQSIELLKQVDYLITLCGPNSTLTDTSKSIQDTAANELLANQSENQSTYKGFVLEIETKKYTDTVNQNRAVGKNQSGIVMIATEYSFASNPNVLIDELKFIIDRDDLKAY